MTEMFGGFLAWGKENKIDMASVFFMTNPASNIDYSLLDGCVRSFVLLGETLYDEDTGTDENGWRDKLVDFVREQGLDVDRNGRGLHAFVYRMQEDGLLPTNA